MKAIAIIITVLALSAAPLIYLVITVDNALDPGECITDGCLSDKYGDIDPADPYNPDEPYDELFSDETQYIYWERWIDD